MTNDHSNNRQYRSGGYTFFTASSTLHTLTRMQYKALLITETPQGKFERSIVKREIDELPKGDVLIRAHYSALNYKDGLSATGHKGITRKFPHTPGIEAAGKVIESASEKFRAGTEVFVTGYDLGMNTSGAFAEYMRVPASACGRGGWP